MIKELYSHELYIEENGFCAATTLFILESPFDTELIEECACVGDTGKRMTKVLGLNSSDSLGKLLKDKNSIARNYAVFNTFKFPLDVKVSLKMAEQNRPHDLWTSCKIPWCSLKIDESKKGSLKKTIQFLKNKRSLKRYFVDYDESLDSFLNNAPHLNNIIVCGNIAQVLFEQKTNIINLNSNLRSFPASINGRSYNLMYTIHPSKWFSVERGKGKKVKDALAVFLRV